MATNTRPSRARTAPAKSAPAKAAPAKAAEKATEAAPATETPEAAESRIRVELEHAGTTKSFERFNVPAEYKAQGVVGSLYAPHGTKRVAVMIVADGDTAE